MVEEINQANQKCKNNLKITLKTENEVIKDRITRDIKTLFEKERNCYIPVRVGNFWSNNYIKYRSNSSRNKNLSINEYLDKIKPYLKGIINDL